MYYNVPNSLVLWANPDAGATSQSWDCTGTLLAGVKYLLEVIYTSEYIALLVDDVEVTRITTPIVFSTVPTIAYAGTNHASLYQADAVFT